MRENNRGKTSSTSSTDLIYGRELPHAKEIERQVLGIIMLHPAVATDAIATMLNEAAFYSENHRRIYSAILDLYKKGENTELPAVVQRLKERGELDLVGGPYHVTELTNAVISSASLQNYCMKLQEKQMRRELITRSGNMYGAAFDEGKDIFDLLDEAEGNVMEISKAIQGESSHISSVLVDTVSKIEGWRKLDNSITGVPSAFPALNRATRGWQPGNLIILAARPSVGKSALALSLARAAAKNDIKPSPVAFFSLEMDKVQLVLRLLAAESGTVLHGLQTGRLDDDNMRQLYIDGISPLAKLPIYFDDTPSLSIVQLRGKARRLKTKYDIGMLIVDYLQLMDGIGSTREQEIASISRGLKKLAKELGIPIIALSQLSRDVEKRTGEKRIPQLSDLRESGAIEQDADLVLFLWAPEDKEIEQNADLLYRRYLRIAKARDGVLLTVHLDFKNEIQAFKEYHEDKSGPPPAQPGNWKPVTEQKLF